MDIQIVVDWYNRIHLVIKRNELSITQAHEWFLNTYCYMKLHRWKKTATYYVIPLIWYSRKYETIEMVSGQWLWGFGFLNR